MMMAYLVPFVNAKSQMVLETKLYFGWTATDVVFLGKTVFQGSTYVRSVLDHFNNYCGVKSFIFFFHCIIFVENFCFYLMWQ